jgi:hypothetical protein
MMMIIKFLNKFLPGLKNFPEAMRVFFEGGSPLADGGSRGSNLTASLPAYYADLVSKPRATRFALALAAMFVYAALVVVLAAVRIINALTGVALWEIPVNMGTVSKGCGNCQLRPRPGMASTRVYDRPYLRLGLYVDVFCPYCTMVIACTMACSVQR